jgi:hypothetical protein
MSSSTLPTSRTSKPRKEPPRFSRSWPWVAALGVVAAAEVSITVTTGSVTEGVLAVSVFVPLLR